MITIFILNLYPKFPKCLIHISQLTFNNAKMIAKYRPPNPTHTKYKLPNYTKQETPKGYTKHLLESIRQVEKYLLFGWVGLPRKPRWYFTSPDNISSLDDIVLYCGTIFLSTMRRYFLVLWDDTLAIFFSFSVLKSSRLKMRMKRLT